MNFGIEKLKMVFGSHVYGTNVPSSDMDYKGIFLPNKEEILLQRAAKHHGTSTKENQHDKNSKDDIDVELFSLQEYLRLLLDGQTVALDMLFIPRKFYVDYKSWDTWEYIQSNKMSLLHSSISSFAGYCKTQAAKYGVKGSRLNIVRKALSWSGLFPAYARLADHHKELNAFVLECESSKLDTMMNSQPLIQLLELENKQTKSPETYLEVCNRKFPLHVTFNYLSKHLQKVYDEYGHRARQAETNEGIDWKALMHAVRVADEARELLLTGNITFPRPNAELLLKIRKGELPYSQVAELIEQGLLELECATKGSCLPSSPNYALMDKIVLNEHLNIIGG